MAQKSNLPIVFSPFSANNPAYLIFASFVGYDRLSRILPTFLWDRMRVMIPGWEFRDKHTVMTRLGPNFIIVTPKDNNYIIADPDVVNEILVRKTGFGRPDIAARM